MIVAHHIHHQFTRFVALASRLVHAALTLVCDSPHFRPQLPSDHKDVVSLFPVLLGLLSLRSGEVLLTRPQRLLNQHTMPSCLTSAQTLLGHPPYCMGCGDISGFFQYHHMEDGV